MIFYIIYTAYEYIKKHFSDNRKKLNIFIWYELKVLKLNLVNKDNYRSRLAHMYDIINNYYFLFNSLETVKKIIKCTLKLQKSYLIKY